MFFCILQCPNSGPCQRIANRTWECFCHIVLRVCRQLIKWDQVLQHSYPHLMQAASAMQPRITTLPMQLLDPLHSNGNSGCRVVQTADHCGQAVSGHTGQTHKVSDRAAYPNPSQPLRGHDVPPTLRHFCSILCVLHSVHTVIGVLLTDASF